MFVVAGMTPHIVLLGAVLLAVGFGYGTWDVSMNAAAHDVEVATDRPLMPRFHGAFSVGGLCGAGLGAARRGPRTSRRRPPRHRRHGSRRHGGRCSQSPPPRRRQSPADDDHAFRPTHPRHPGG